MANYWQDPDATEAVMSDGFYRTGDVGRVHEDGVIEIVDRIRNMIISGGYNVYPAEVERVLLDHPAVVRACVYGVPDPKWGEVVAAAVTLNRPREVTAEEIGAFCGAQLAGYKKPRRIQFVDEFPLGPTGKVMISELRRRHEGGEIDVA
jgi:acyl-CoA synthetase (AMP-forming)/AMP-acid ligase II